MNSSIEKPWTRKSRIFILFYLGTVIIYAARPLRIFALTSLELLIGNPEGNSVFVIALFVLFSMMTPLSFLVKRNLQGPFAVAGVYSIYFVIIVDLCFLKVVAGMNQRAEFHGYKYIYPLYLELLSYILVMIT
jgi:hypothetical protein